MINRRSFITGLIAAPAIIRTPSLLMPVRDRLKMVPFEFAPVIRFGDCLVNVDPFASFSIEGHPPDLLKMFRVGWGSFSNELWPKATG